MGSFDRTPEALDQHFSLASHRLGVHKSGTVGVGLSNQRLGDVEYDPMRHSPSDINHYSIRGLIDGNKYVRQVKKTLPVDVHVIKDSTVRHEMPQITALKRGVVDRLSNEIDQSISAVTDKFFAFDVAESELADRGYHENRVHVMGRGDLPEVAENEAAMGINFLVSDFKAVRFEPASLEDTIALKVNHLLERQVPQGIGRISVRADGPDLDTGNKRQLTAFNQERAEEHAMIVEHLKQAGAKVVSIVIDPRAGEANFDLHAADSQIADSIKELDDF